MDFISCTDVYILLSDPIFIYTSTKTLKHNWFQVAGERGLWTHKIAQYIPLQPLSTMSVKRNCQKRYHPSSGTFLGGTFRWLDSQQQSVVHVHCVPERLLTSTVACVYLHGLVTVLLSTTCTFQNKGVILPFTKLLRRMQILFLRRTWLRACCHVGYKCDDSTLLKFKVERRTQHWHFKFVKALLYKVHDSKLAVM